jgi:hypothetical protein
VKHPSRVPRAILASVLLLVPLCRPAHAESANVASSSSAFDGAEVVGSDDLMRAYSFYRGGQLDEALALLKPVAQQGEAAAQYVLGSMYASGEGVPQDDAQAVQWWRKAAEQGLARAQSQLGVWLLDGIGIPADTVEAQKWCRKAAEQGLAVAQVNLGLMYLNGLGGLRKDDREAVAWFRKAAEQGLGWAQYYLGLSYLRGQGVASDAVTSARWFTRAAEQEYTEAEYLLAGMYASGNGVARDYARAAFWLARATVHGHPQSEVRLQRLLPMLSRVRLPEGLVVRQTPEAGGLVASTASGSTYAYVVDRDKGWVRVILTQPLATGYVSARELRRK